MQETTSEILLLIVSSEVESVNNLSRYRNVIRHYGNQYRCVISNKIFMPDYFLLLNGGVRHPSPVYKVGGLRSLKVCIKLQLNLHVSVKGTARMLVLG